MKMDILSLLDSKKVEAKDLEETGIHKIVHSLYKTSDSQTTSGLRAIAKKLILYWKKVLKNEKISTDKSGKKEKPSAHSEKSKPIDSSLSVVPATKKESSIELVVHS